MIRTHKNNELSLRDVGKEVILEGFVSKIRNTGKKVFLDLRDFYGITQIIIDEKLVEEFAKIKQEWVIRVEGVVVKRISANSEISTGDIEVVANKIKIISKASLLPFEVKNSTEAHEDTRFKYRYLDIRRDPVKNKIKLRSELYHFIRNFMHNEEFVEIPTPILGRATPEGARDFIIPSRLNKNKYYALPQSPQLYKQLFMVSGIDKYYQIARSFRDEDLRNDRQLEFDQLDLEMAFAKQDDVIELIERLVKYIIKNIAKQDIDKIERISFKDALDKYGVDKPDIRFELFIKTLNNLFSKNEFEVFKDSSKVIRGIAIEEILMKKEIEDLNEIARQNNVSFFSFIKYEGGQWSGSLNSKLSNEEKENLLKEFSIKEKGTFIICSDRYDKVCSGFGQIRNYIGKTYNLYDTSALKPCFIVDFPLFEWSDEENRYVSAHNPFTMPSTDFIDDFEAKKEIASAASYDLVINGYEIGSGAERITDPEIQNRMFNAIDMNQEEIESNFGWFINGYKYGSPYHAGMGLGLDRLVMIFTNSDSIREVVAFPKNSNGVCYLTDAPGQIDDEVLKSFK